jgi:hypothetical protein
MDENKVHPVLGKVHRQRTYLYYDQPVLFSAKSPTGRLYVVLLVEEEPGFDRWMLVPVSAERLREIEHGNVTLREAILTSEEGIVLFLRESADGVEEVESASVEAISEDDLPADDFAMQIRDVGIAESVGSLAQARAKDLLVVKLHPAEGPRSKITTDSLGHFLVALQSVVTGITYRGTAARGRISAQLAERTSLLVTEAVPGSFTVHMESASDVGLTEQTEVTQALELLLKLLAAGSDKDLVVETVGQCGIRTAVRYKHLMKRLKDDFTSATVSWGAPDATSATATLSGTQANEVWELLREQAQLSTGEEDVIGQLVGVDVDTLQFHLIDEAGRDVKGAMTEAIAQEVFEVPLRAKMTLITEVKYNEVTMAETLVHTLTRVEGFGPGHNTDAPLVLL